MKNTFAVQVFVCMALANGPLWAQGRPARDADRGAVRNGWLLSLAEGKAEARKTGKPLMVVLRCEP